ncbi:hypothetical protein DPMN_063161 [Dreissena polymorpha]|uniref:Uncharacterized protein n=1 Tax=Dreissena polymorpha TaxID=45954 RepID=A0A9D4CAU6_DREPO|nr:hypothetical protein DPMN_063161 [Dreissena polymorpha]
MLLIILNRLKSKPMNCWPKSRLDSELDGAQGNRSSTAESSMRNTNNTNVSSSTTSLT